MKTPTNYPTVSPALELAAHPAAATQRWLPSLPAGVTVDLNHWQSRAARGFTWNRGGHTKRRAH
jgi:hypothetical protein